MNTPRDGHSLILVGQAAFLEAINVIFSFHTSFLNSDRQSYICAKEGFYETILSCRSDAVQGPVQGYHPIHEALAKIARHENETPKTCSEPNGLHDRVCKLETGIYAGCFFWHDILDRC